MTAGDAHIMDDQNKNLILATALSFLVILVWFVLFPPEEPQPQPPAVATAADGTAVLPPAAQDTGVAIPSLAVTPEQSRAQALGSTQRIYIETPRL